MATMSNRRSTTLLAIIGLMVSGSFSSRGFQPATGPASDSAVRPFRIAVPDATLTDLSERLARTRFPDEIEGAGWTYGTNLAYLRTLVEYWRTEYDWRAQERRLNEFPQFTTTIEDIEIHFIHQRSSHPNALPLLLLHGWPSSFYEFTKVIGPLSEPTRHGGRAEDAFHVVVMSLPGYGFSGKPGRPGYGTRRTAEIAAQLMARLGYERYGAQGGDWGAHILRQLGQIDQVHLIGIHSNMCRALQPPATTEPYEGVPAEERRLIAETPPFRSALSREGGYGEIQRTRPQTLAYGLNDSPAGQAAWILEKWRTWSDSDGDPEKRFTKDELLTTIMIYWVTETANSSARMYYEARAEPIHYMVGRVEVPVACAWFAREIVRWPRRWVEAQYNLVRWTEIPRGGHFAAFEEPELLVGDVRAFFRELPGR